MTQSQSLVFTALPAGVTPNGLQLSVFVSPKLSSTDADPKLSSFAAWTNWPAVRRQLRFTAHVKRLDGSTFGTIDLPNVPFGSEAAWKKIFTPETSIKAPAVQPTGRPASYDVTEVKNSVRELYANHVSRPVGIAAQPISNRFTDVRRYTEDELQRGIMAAGANRTALAFRSLQAFHLPAPRLAAFVVSDAKNPDFNSKVGAVGQYPHLLRLLNLVIEFTIPAAQLPPGDYQIAVVPSGATTLFTGIDTTVVSPWTSSRRGVLGNAPRSLEFFRPIARDGTADGLVDLRKSRFVVAVEDIDGAAFNALDYLERTRSLLASPTPGAFQGALPALRNKGIQFFDLETADEIAAARARSDQLATDSQAAAVAFPPSGPMATAPVLWWDDLVRGHRIDARDGNGPWRSLCARRSAIDISAAERHSADEEGFVTLSLSNANTASGADQKTSQVLFRWNGWSLVAPRPGAAVADDGTPSRTPVGSFLPIQDKALPGTLEKLRFGMKLRFRCRGVDLAGNSWRPNGPAYEALGVVWRDGSPEVEYLRHEPVLPPRTPTNFESGTTNLIVGLSARDQKTAKSSVTLRPPLASLDRVEKHGVFDRMSPEHSYALLRRTAPSPDGRPGAALIDPAYGGIVVRETWPRQIMHGTVKTGSAALDADATSIKITGRPGGYAVTLSGHNVSASVPPGGAMQLHIASFVPSKIRKLFDTHGASADELTSNAYELIAPPESITVLHPVEKPLAAPDFGQARDEAIPVVQVQRTLGDTHALFDDPGFTVATESTARFDVAGEWMEVSDVPNGSEWPSRIKRKARLFGADVPLPPDHPLATVAALTRGTLAAAAPRSLINSADSTYDFRDTKFRTVRLVAAGVSRFQNLYKKTTKDLSDRFIRSSAAVSVDVPNSKPPKSPNISYIVPTVARSSSDGHSGRTTLHTEGWGLRVYMEPGGWFDSGDGERLAALIAQPPAQGTLSQIAGDPIVTAGAVVNDLTTSDFMNAVSEHPNLQQVISSNADATKTQASDRAAYRYVSASVFDVGYDFQKKLLYAEIAMRRRAAYRPFVRLALARFQPKSVPGAHLSSTVFADFIQLTPERTLSVTRTSRHVRLRLTGSFPKQDATHPVGTRIVAIVQTAHDRSDDALWSERGRQLFAYEFLTNTGESIWDCTLLLAMFNKGSFRRVIIEEWEVWSHPAALPDPEIGRLVYSEAVDL